MRFHFHYVNQSCKVWCPHLPTEVPSQCSHVVPRCFSEFPGVVSCWEQGGLALHPSSVSLAVQVVQGRSAFSQTSHRSLWYLGSACSQVRGEESPCIHISLIMQRPLCLHPTPLVCLNNGPQLMMVFQKIVRRLEEMDQWGRALRFGSLAHFLFCFQITRPPIFAIMPSRP